MYYEFFENLKFLNNLTLNEHCKIIVNIHPSHKNLVNDLKEFSQNFQLQVKKLIINR